jgi:hypothetical protein
MKFIPQSIALMALLCLWNPSASAQQDKPLPETKVVLRISRECLHELTGKEFQREEAIAKNISGADVRGQARIDCKFDVKLRPSETESSFDLVANGTFATQMTATRRIVQVNLHGIAPFDAQRRIVFDGKAFTGREIEMQATHQSSIDQIRSSRGGLIGAIARGAARKSANRNLPEGDQQISEEIRVQLTKALEEESDKRMASMNTKVKMILKEAEHLLREEKVLAAEGTQRYFATTEHHMCMSFGPLDHCIPKLPVLDPAKAASIELWIAKGDGVNLVVESWALIKPAVFERVARRSPEIAKMLEEVRVESVKGWYVATLSRKDL